MLQGEWPTPNWWQKRDRQPVNDGIKHVEKWHYLKDTQTSLATCLAPSLLTASTVPAYGHLPPSLFSPPTVSSQPGNTLAARTGAMQHKLKQCHKYNYFCLFGFIWLNVPVRNFSVMPG